jgi:hypothetical protein
LVQATGTSVAAGQRVTAVFEMANTSSTRQRVTVSLQEADATSFVSCVFWLAPGTARRAYAMTTYAPVAWTNATWAVVPSNGGSETTHGWLELDTVSFAKTTDAILGTECFEPGSFTVSGGAPVPVPLPTPDSLSAAMVGSAPAAANRATRSGAVSRWSRDRDRAAGSERPEAPMPDGSGPPASDADPNAVGVLLTIAGAGTGTVTSSPAGLACAGSEVSCTGWFAEGATVTLTATPAPGHAFAGWSGACSGTGSCVLFIDGEKTATATFNGPPTTTYYHTDVLGSVRATTDA